MWYSIYNILSYLILSIILLLVIYHMIIRITKSKVIINTCITMTVIYLLFWHCNAGRIEDFINYPSDMNWSGMVTQQKVPYIQDSDIEKIHKYLDTFRVSNKPIYVQFFPGSDSLFFHDVEDETIRLSQPLFFGRKPDIFIVHMSKYMPEWWLEITLKEVYRSGINSIEDMNVLFQRDNSEKWYCFTFLNLP